MLLNNNNSDHIIEESRDGILTGTWPSALTLTESVDWKSLISAELMFILKTNQDV